MLTNLNNPIFQYMGGANYATTAFCYSCKAELAQAAHCFLATQTGVTCTCSSTTNMTGLTSVAGIAVGMAVTGSNAAANTVVAKIVSQTALTLSAASTGALTSATFTADQFNMLLIKASPGLTYSGTQTNVGTPSTGVPSTSNVGTDETSGSGYSTGGFALTNVSPQVGSTAGYWSFSANPSWTSATFSTTAGIIYNTSVRLGAGANGVTANASGSAVNRAISVHDFGGTQTVSSGTFTVVLPSNAQGTAILQIS